HRRRAPGDRAGPPHEHPRWCYLGACRAPGRSRMPAVPLRQRVNSRREENVNGNSMSTGGFAGIEQLESKLPAAQEPKLPAGDDVNWLNADPRNGAGGYERPPDFSPTFLWNANCVHRSSHLSIFPG